MMNTDKYHHHDGMHDIHQYDQYRYQLPGTWCSILSLSVMHV